MASEQDSAALWRRYRDHLCICEQIGLTLDISRMNFDEGFFQRMAPAMQDAYRAMDELEAGAFANPDENRQVGHYWLRAPDRAPDDATADAIRTALDQIRRFAADVHERRITPPQAERFTDLLVIGIGGSALGPQLVADALGQADRDPLTPHFIDNTDPDGIERTLRSLEGRVGSTLVIVISKSGGTPETRNGMLLVRAAFEKDHLDFAPQAVAITGVGSKLDQLADEEGWLLRLPMWDWVGGRTSETGPVGLLPAALQGVDIDQMLEGAAACDQITRTHETARNPAALLALMWHHATNGRGEKDMVLLPYKDRLLLMSRYLQQLVMESLGKARDLDGNEVEQGISVYGNKGSTDQHAYIQQLREGVNNFFVTFIRVLEAGGAPEHREIEPGVTAGDYLQGFLLGTRRALHENSRESMTLTVNRVDAFTVGALIALFERAVGFYASLVNINAYHQPGVEAGKKAAASVLDLQQRMLDRLKAAGEPMSAEQLAAAIEAPDAVETIHHLLEHLAANQRIVPENGLAGTEARYRSR